MSLYPTVGGDGDAPGVAVPGGALAAEGAPVEAEVPATYVSDDPYASDSGVSQRGGAGPSDFHDGGSSSGGSAAAAAAGGAGGGDDDANSDDDGDLGDWGFGDVTDLQDFGMAEAVGHASVRGPFRWHVLVAAVVTMLNFLIWFFVGFGSDKVTPWFIFVACGFAISLAVHYYLFLTETRKLLQLHLVTFAAVNVICFTIWAASNEYLSTWWIIVFFAWGMVVQAHRSIVRFARSGASRTAKILHFARVQNLALSLFLFILYLDTHPNSRQLCNFLELNYGAANSTTIDPPIQEKLDDCERQGDTVPWFFFPIFGVGIAHFILWWALRGKRQLFTLHLGLYTIINVLLFTIWMVATGSFPWSVIVALSWGLGLFAHYWIFERTKSADAAAAPAPLTSGSAA